MLSRNTACCVLRPRAAARKPSPVLYESVQRIDLVSLGRAHESAGGKHHGDRLVGHELGLFHGLRGFALHELRTARVAVLRRIGLDLVAHQVAQLLLALEQRLEPVALLGQLRLLLADLHFLELRQVAQLGLEDHLGLLFAELEARHQLRLGLVLAPDDADHLVEVQVDDQQAFEQVQAARHLLQAVGRRRLHRGDAELQPARQQLLAAP